MGRISVILLLVAIANFGVQAQEISKSLEEADTAFKSGLYSESKQIYLNAIQDGAMDADLFYNLSVSLYKNGELGAAVAALLQAIQMRPSDTDFKKSLQFLSEKSRDRALFLPTAAWTEHMLGIAWFNVRLLLWFATGLLSLGLLTLVYFVRWGKLKKGLGLISGGAVFCLGLTWGLMLLYWADKRLDRGSVVLEKVDVVANPSLDKAMSLFELHAGAPFKVLVQSGDWYKIQLADSRSGWLHRESLAIFGEKHFSYQSSRNAEL